MDIYRPAVETRITTMKKIGWVKGLLFFLFCSSLSLNNACCGSAQMVNPGNGICKDLKNGYTIRVRYPESARSSIPDISTIYISSPAGPVPLRELASLRKSYTRTKFTRQNLEPIVDIYGYRATAAITHLHARIQKVLAGLSLPPGYRLSFEGEVKNMHEAGKRQG